jgi:hypothetical protein
MRKALPAQRQKSAAAGVTSPSVTGTWGSSPAARGDETSTAALARRVLKGAPGRQSSGGPHEEDHRHEHRREP